MLRSESEDFPLSMSPEGPPSSNSSSNEEACKIPRPQFFFERKWVYLNRGDLVKIETHSDEGSPGGNDLENGYHVLLTAEHRQIGLPDEIPSFFHFKTYHCKAKTVKDAHEEVKKYFSDLYKNKKDDVEVGEWRNFNEYDIVEHIHNKRLCGKIHNIINKNNPYLNYERMSDEEEKMARTTRSADEKGKRSHSTADEKGRRSIHNHYPIWPRKIPV